MLFKLLDQNCVNGILALHVVKYILSSSSVQIGTKLQISSSLIEQKLN